MITMARGICIFRNPVRSFQIFSIINLTSSTIIPKRKNLYFRYNLHHKNIFPVLFFLWGQLGQGWIRILDFFKVLNFPKNWKKKFCFIEDRRNHSDMKIYYTIAFLMITSLEPFFQKSRNSFWKPHLHHKIIWTFEMISIDLE